MPRPWPVIPLSAAFLWGCASVVPPAAHVDWVGIYTASIARRIDSPTSITGKVSVPSGVQPVRRTTQIPASLGTRFGVGYVFDGRSADSQVQHRVVWYFPPGGLTNPETSRTAVSSTRSQTCLVDAPCLAGYSFNEPWELVPGRWTVEVWLEQQLVIRQTFEVFIE